MQNSLEKKFNNNSLRKTHFSIDGITDELEEDFLFLIFPYFVIIKLPLNKPHVSTHIFREYAR
jgi:hypothetical protein